MMSFLGVTRERNHRTNIQNYFKQWLNAFKMSKINPAPDFHKQFAQLKRDIPRKASVMALNFFKKSFDKQGFMDSSFRAWPNRKGGSRPGGSVLVNTGHLRDSTVIDRADMDQISIANDAPYASIHNEGGIVRIPVTKKMKKYFWYMYKATGQAKYKWMALTKKEHFLFRMPKRQFIGESAELMNRLDRMLANEITRMIRSLK